MLFEINVLKNCIKGHHGKCISKNCQCTCHEERDINKLQTVKIIPKTYCLKCERNYLVETDSCKVCSRHLIRQPNYFHGKIRFQDSMGNYEWQRWETNKKVRHEEYLKLQEQRELEGRLYFPTPYQKSYYSKKNRIKRFLKRIIQGISLGK